MIIANNEYYPISRVPEFWDWLLHHATIGNLQMPRETYEEITDGKKTPDALSIWAKTETVKSVLIFPEEADPSTVARVADVYAADLTDEEVVKIGRDAFLISYAVERDDRCVVTTEVSAPKTLRANKKVPDVCKTLGVDCCNTFELTRALDFSTRWRA